MGPLKEGYKIFRACCTENSGWEKVAQEIEHQIHAAAKEYDIEFLSNAKIDSDSGAGREVYFGYQCAYLRKKGTQSELSTLVDRVLKFLERVFKGKM